ncbi:MAG: hypothetical protein ACKO45_12445 [Cyanobium sp.]
MSPIFSPQVQAESREMLADAELEQVHGGLAAVAFTKVRPLLIKELVCRQGVPLDVLSNKSLQAILTRPFGR